MTSLKDIQKYYEKMAQYKKKCIKCGHSITITPINQKRICSWCGTLNYYDDKTKFKEKIKNALKK